MLYIRATAKYFVVDHTYISVKLNGEEVAYVIYITGMSNY